MEQNKGKVIALCGKIASGKTYYANQIKESENAVVFSIDELTYYLFDNRKGENYIEITQRALNYFKEKSIEYTRKGINVILDIGLWTKKEREDISKFYTNNDVRFEIHYIDIDDKSWENNIYDRNKRIEDGNKGFDFYVTEGLKKKMYENWEEPTRDEVDLIYKVDRKGCSNND